MPDLFLSYSRDDQARAKLFAEAFAREGFDVWWDAGLRAGEAYDAVTEQALREAKAVVVLWSKRSVASRWVRAEATLALRNKTLVPATIEPCDRPIMFELTHTAELSHWNGDAADVAFRSFVGDLRNFIGRVATANDVATPREKDKNAAGSTAASTGTSAAKTKLLTTVAGIARRPLRVPVLVAVAAMVIISASGFMLSRSLQSTERGTTGRLAYVAVALPDGYVIGPSQLEPVTISHDGSRIAFAAIKDGKSMLFVRAFDQPEARLIDGTEGADAPFFSPDGQWLGYFANEKLRKVPVVGGAPKVLADARFHRGGDWGDDGFIYFAPTNGGGIWRVPEGGGAVAQVTKLDPRRGEISHRWPHHVRGTDTLLFSAWTGPGDDEGRIATQSTDVAGHRWLVEGQRPRYAPEPGLLAYRYGKQLLTVPWDPSRPELGKAVPLKASIEPVDGARNEGTGNYAFGEDGTLVYLRTEIPLSARRPTWVDRSGKVSAMPLEVRRYENVALSPDGTRAVLQIREGTTRLWIYDLARETLTPLRTGPGSSQGPLWSADGRRVIYRGTRQGTRNLYQIAVDGSGEEQRLTSKPGVVQVPSSISADGQLLLFSENGPDERFSAGTWVMSLSGDGQPRRLFPAEIEARNAQLSPDGRWVAYETTVDSRSEIFVAPFRGEGERRMVSTDGGEMPLWSRDGRELFFTSGKGLMVVTVSSGDTLTAGTPRVLHAGPFSIYSINASTGYAVTPDGDRLLSIRPVAEDQNIRQIEVVFNWLKSR